MVNKRSVVVRLVTRDTDRLEICFRVEKNRKKTNFSVSGLPRRSRLQRFDFICDTFFYYRGQIIYHLPSHCARMDTKRIHKPNFQGLSLHIGACDVHVCEWAMGSVWIHPKKKMKRKERLGSNVKMYEKENNNVEMRREWDWKAAAVAAADSRNWGGCQPPTADEPTTTKFVRTMATTLAEVESAKDKHVEF